MDDRTRRELERVDIAHRVLEAAVRLHFCAHQLGDTPRARQLRLLADAVHDVGRDLKRG